MKGIPSKEEIKVEQRMLSGNTYYITKNESTFFLYILEGDTAKKIDKAKNPFDFDETIAEYDRKAKESTTEKKSSEKTTKNNTQTKPKEKTTKTTKKRSADK